MPNYCAAGQLFSDRTGQAALAKYCGTAHPAAAHKEQTPDTHGKLVRNL
jgi:hypothetical protein